MGWKKRCRSGIWTCGSCITFSRLSQSFCFTLNFGERGIHTYFVGRIREPYSKYNIGNFYLGSSDTDDEGVRGGDVSGIGGESHKDSQLVRCEQDQRLRRDRDQQALPVCDHNEVCPPLTPLARHSGGAGPVCGLGETREDYPQAKRERGWPVRRERGHQAC